jgi:hypothetical protein
MQIQAAGSASYVSQAASVYGRTRAAAPTAQQSPKGDSLVLSEKAKDLAALKAGKSASEEATESLAVKNKEGDSD